MGQFGIGQPLRRVEDQRFLTGTGRYTDDIRLEHEAHAVIVRSPFAHADILSINLEDALESPGVLAIYTADDLAKAGIRDIPCVAGMKNGVNNFVRHDRRILARERVRHVGDPVAMVVAETLAQARDAAELVEVDYEERPSVTDTASAIREDAPHVWDDTPNNHSFVWHHGNREETDAAFSGAEHVVSLTLVNNRIVVNSLEPRVAIADFDGEKYQLFTPSQGVHNIKNQLASAIFDIDPAKLRVVTPDVGGGFGMKLFVHPEQPLVLFAAQQLKRPVRWTAERSSDAFLSDVQGRDHVSHAELALDKDLNFLGLRVTTTANLGAYLSNYAPFVVTMAGCRMLAGVR